MSPTAKKKAAIDAPRSNLFHVLPEDLTLVTEKGHPLYDPRVDLPVSDAMVASILTKGVVENVIVRKNGPLLEVVDGRQRVKGAKEANKRMIAEGAEPIRVPVVIRKENDGDAYETMIALNEIRQNDDVLTKAEKAINLINRHGKTEEQAAEAFGVTMVTMRAWLKISDLAPQVRTSIKAGRLSASEAVKELSDLTREEQIERLPGLEATAASASKNRAKPGDGGPRKKKDSPLARLRRLGRNDSALTVLTPRERAILRWVFGDDSDGDLVNSIPRLSEFVKGKKRA